MAGADPAGALAAPRWVADASTGDFIGIDAVTGQLKLYSATTQSSTAVSNFPDVQKISAAAMPLAAGSAQEAGNLSDILCAIRQQAASPFNGQVQGPAFTQPQQVDVNNVLNPVPVTQSGTWGVAQAGTWNVGQTQPWTVSLSTPNTDATGAILVSLQSLYSIDPKHSLQLLRAVSYAHLQLVTAQAQVAGGGFVPYEVPPF